MTRMGLLNSRRAPERTLAVALAHCMASCKPTDQERLALLNKLYHALSFAEAFQCRRELLECQQARRAGIMHAVRA